MLLSNIDYTVVYVDPTIATAGNGTTPALALNNLPATLANNTCYLVRRTAEANMCTLAGAASAVVNVALWGMPTADDEEWQMVPAEAKTAWGADTADYANVKSTTPGTALTLASVKNFSLSRVYLFREASASPNAYIFNFTGTGGDSSIRFSRCRFGAAGINIDDLAYTLPVSSQALRMYASTAGGRVFSLERCIINHAAPSSNRYAFNVGPTDYIQIADNKITTMTTGSSSTSQYVIFINDNNSSNISRLDICNLAVDIIPHGGNQYMSMVLRSGFISAMLIRGITVTMSRIMTGSALTNLQTNAPIFWFNGVYNFALADFSATLPYLWRCQAGGGILRVDGGSAVPGAAPERSIKNVSVQLAEVDGIGNGSDISLVPTNADYSAVSIDFSGNFGYNYGSNAPMRATGITVNHPRGQAFCGRGITLSNATFKGMVRLASTGAVIAAIESWYPCNALVADSYTTVTVDTITVKTDNADYPYTGQPIVASNDKYCVVYVDTCNVPLQPNTAAATTTIPNAYAVICGNEGVSGHFAQRTNNCICDTWTVYRQDGAPASLKLFNNAVSVQTSMLLGQHPFAGIRITPTAAGKYLLKVYLATKITDLSELGQRFIVLATVPGNQGQRLYYSNIHGQIGTDASYWLNDEGLTAKVLTIPITVEKTGAENAIDIKMDFKWYSPDGFLYVDPAVKLIPIV